MTLRANDVSVRFAGVNAIDHVSVALDQGEILGLIGPNGAGTTTLVNVLSGFQQPATGTVSIFGHDAARRPADWFSRNGVVRTFQAVRLFKGMSVSENVEVGQRPGAAQQICSTAWAWPIVPRNWAARSTMATSAASVSPARWRCRRNSCCSTNRPPA